MSSLSRTFARASRRGKKLMEQYQPGKAKSSGPRIFVPERLGQVAAAVKRHRNNRIARLSRRVNR